MYSVFEAKKFAEGAPSVGKETFMTVMSADGTNKMLSVKSDHLLDGLYQKYGPKKAEIDFKIGEDFYYKK